jgi:hypothetical protein
MLYIDATLRSIDMPTSLVGAAPCFWYSPAGGEFLVYRLTPAVYLWADRVTERAESSGKLTPEQLATLSDRWCYIAAWAAANLPRAALSLARQWGKAALPEAPMDLETLQTVKAAVAEIEARCERLERREDPGQVDTDAKALEAA